MVNTITYNEAIKVIRKEAKELGMVFKRQKATINGSQAYKFVASFSEVVLDNQTLWGAYENIRSGYIRSLVE